MSLLSRSGNLFRGRKLSREIDEELQSHLDEAVAEGRDVVEARKAFGSVDWLREESRNAKVIPWLDSLRADVVFGWRQIVKRKVVSAAAVLSLALAIGACTSAFRLIDALLLRPLPIAGAERLYSCYHKSILSSGKVLTLDGYEYPMFGEMRAAVKDQAELLAVSLTGATDVIFNSGQEREKAYLQYVSGRMFPAFELRPALGRLLSGDDDSTPGAHPYAVLSYDYWTRRFGRDPKVLGRTFRLGESLFEIVGVAEQAFTGIEPGTVTDIFVPTMMNRGVTQPDRSWIRILVQLHPGVDAAPVRDRLRIPFRTFREEMAKRRFNGDNQERVNRFLNEALMLEPASAGISDLQREYRRPLAALGALVALVLLIACANVANLMAAQATARAREMALRVAIGAGRLRLVQLVLIESAMLAMFAALVGSLFAWWSAPLVVAMVNPPDNPARLLLPLDWRVIGFEFALTVCVMLLFGLAPALRASAVKPAGALKGGEDPHSRRRMMHALIATQAAFCFVVLFLAGLFIATFERLSTQPTGFSTERILLVDVEAPQANPVLWEQVAAHLRTLPGVERVALAGWPLLKGDATIGSISVGGRPPSADTGYFMDVSPGWLATMEIPLRSGRDFNSDDTEPGRAIASDAFVEEYFNGENPIGKYFERVQDHTRFEIVGLVRDARYRDIRGPFLPVVYVPFRWVDGQGAPRPKSGATIIVRTSNWNPLSLARTLRREVPRARPEFHVVKMQTQAELNQSKTLSERLLARLAMFFAVVGLLLAGVGLYGVLDYSVLQRRREIGIRVAIGEPAFGIARLVTLDVFSMVLVGAIVGLALGLTSVRFIESLLYGVNATDFGVLALPVLTILVAALLTALPAVIRAVRIDPARTLRAD